MVGSGAEPSGNNHKVQAPRAGLRAALLLGLTALLLGGCAGASGPLDPVTWWHDIGGGPLTGKLQPIPGATAPYPNLADVPKAPQFTAPAERASISAALLADRAAAHRQMVLAPLAPPPAAPTPAPAAPVSAGASQEAASAALPAAAPAPSATTARPAASPAPSLAPASVAEALALLPSVPAAPPPPPGIARVPLPSLPPAPSASERGALVRLAFAAGSSVLSPADRARLATVAARRGSARLAVLGYGGAIASDAAAQAAALRLALARAKVVAAALTAAGVPPAAVSLEAEASGSGAAVRLVGGA